MTIQTTLFSLGLVGSSRYIRVCNITSPCLTTRRQTNGAIDIAEVNRRRIRSWRGFMSRPPSASRLNQHLTSTDKARMTRPLFVVSCCLFAERTGEISEESHGRSPLVRREATDVHRGHRTKACEQRCHHTAIIRLLVVCHLTNACEQRFSHDAIAIYYLSNASIRTASIQNSPHRSWRHGVSH